MITFGCIDLKIKQFEQLREGQPCHHPGCLHHVTHPCEGCGRIAGKNISDKNDLSNE